MRRLLLLLGLVLLGACENAIVPDSPEACRMERLTSVTLRPSGALWVVDVQVEGKPATLMLDTGASSVLLIPAAVTRLGVRIVEGRYGVATGSGTTVYRRALEIDTLMIGTEKIERLRFPELEGAHWASRDFDGILGMDAFARYDVEIDFPGGTLNLYRKRFCPNGAPPWTGRHVSAPASAPGTSQGLPVVPAELDGQAARALIDTGASISVIDDDLARRAGGGEVPATGPQTTQAQTVGDTLAEMRRRQFRQLQVAGLRFSNPALWIGQLGTGLDMLFGQDVLRHTRLWISNGSDRVYISVPARPPAAAPGPPAAPR